MKKDNSFIELCFKRNGEKLFLRVVAIWDSEQNQWISFKKTPITDRLIYGSGRNLEALQISFIDSMNSLAEENEELGKEIDSMFTSPISWKD